MQVGNNVHVWSVLISEPSLQSLVQPRVDPQLNHATEGPNGTNTEKSHSPQCCQEQNRMVILHLVLFVRLHFNAFCNMTT